MTYSSRRLKKCMEQQSMGELVQHHTLFEVYGHDF